jgi:hypothetical protein
MHVRHSLERKMEGMHMANQSLARRQSTEVVVQQHTPGKIVARTQSQLQELRSVAVTTAVEYDKTRYELEAIVTRPGRSPGHQRYMEERTAYLQSIYDGAVQQVVTRAVRDIINEAPTEIVRTVYVPEPRKSLFQALTGR